MANSNAEKDDQLKNPNEDSIVTDNLTGKKVDADLDLESDRPSDEDNLVTQESQKGKKVDRDPDDPQDMPTENE